MTTSPSTLPHPATARTPRPWRPLLAAAALTGLLGALAERGWDILFLEPDAFDYRVFEITTEISRQVFPLELDIDNPAFFAGLKKLREINDRNGEWQKKGGMTAKLGKAWTAVAASATMIRHMVWTQVAPWTREHSSRS